MIIKLKETKKIIPNLGQQNKRCSLIPFLRRRNLLKYERQVTYGLEVRVVGLDRAAGLGGRPPTVYRPVGQEVRQTG